MHRVPKTQAGISEMTLVVILLILAFGLAVSDLLVR